MKWAVLLIVVGTVVYANSLDGPFIFDDRASIVENPRVRELGRSTPQRSEITPVTGRPVVRLSFVINHALGGLDPRGYHTLNIIVHLLAALTLFGVVRRTLQGGLPASHIGEDATQVAFACALIWMVHPLLTETVDYLSQRSESIMGLFYLFTLYCAIRANNSPRRSVWFALGIGACALGMASKEVMVTAPLMVLLYALIFRTKSVTQMLRESAAFYAGLAATWGILAWLMLTQPRSDSVGLSLGVSAWDYLLNQCLVVVRYLRLALWPHPLVLDYGTPRPITLGQAAPYAAILLLLLLAVVLALRRKPALGYLGAWVFVILAPTSSVVPIVTEVGAERRMYLPLAGMVVLGVIAARAALQLTPRGRRATAGSRRLIPALLLVTVVVLFSTATFLRNRDYRSEVAIWETSVRALPDVPRSRTNLGKALQTAGRTGDAITQYKAAIELDPQYAEAHNNLGAAMRLQGKLEESSGHLLKALRLEPRYAGAHYNLGLVYQAQRRTTEAVVHYRRAVDLEPDFAEAHNNLGTALGSQGRTEEALVHFLRALEIDPAYEGARRNLAFALKKLGQDGRVAIP